MKNSILVLSVIALGFISCEKENVQPSIEQDSPQEFVQRKQWCENCRRWDCPDDLADIEHTIIYPMKN